MIEQKKSRQGESARTFSACKENRFYLFSFLAAQHSFFSASFFSLQQDDAAFSALLLPHDADVAFPSFLQQLFASACFAQDFASAASFVQHVCSVLRASFFGFESSAPAANPSPVPVTAMIAALNKIFFILSLYLKLMINKYACKENVFSV
jgi:hypothetical protein